MSNNLGVAKYKRILLKTKGACYYCGSWPEGIDHIVPKSKGGTDDEANLVPCCNACNTRKGHLSIEEARVVFALPIKFSPAQIDWVEKHLCPDVRTRMENKAAEFKFWFERETTT